MTFNKETNEIAKPSQLLSKIKAYMSVLQTVENYVHLGKNLLQCLQTVVVAAKHSSRCGFILEATISTRKINKKGKWS